MENYSKIDWKKGLDITPEIFIRSDNYHIAERNLLGRFLAFRTYGILPNSRFHIEKNIENNSISVRNLECTAITNEGYLINVKSDTHYPRITNISETDSELYLVLTIDPYALLVDERGVATTQMYGFVFKKMDEPIEKGIPILKIFKESQGWRIDDNYIPPAVALNAVNDLKQKYIEINNLLSIILEKFPEEEMQLMMLHLEMNNYSMQASPQEFVLLLKKYCLIFQRYLKTAKNMEESSVYKKFMEESYNHLEIGNVLKTGFACLTMINQNIDEKTVPEEDPLAALEIKI
jgi:hypothetical protein